MREEELRTARMLGEEGVRRLNRARVAVFGVGGVGGYLCEALARAGVGELTLFDADCVSLSNINRQIIALHSTVGKPKVEVMRDRINEINPDCRVHCRQVFYLPENAGDYPLTGYDYVADAVDTVSAKIELAVRCRDAGVPLIAAMGAGNKLDPTLFRVCDLSKTEGCPLARTMRRELKKRGICHLKTVFSPEQPAPIPMDAPAVDPADRAAPGSLSFVPAVAGLIMAGEIIKEIAGGKLNRPEE